MGLGKKLLTSLRRVPRSEAAARADPMLIAAGWERHAEGWRADKLQLLASHSVQHLHEKSTVENASDGNNTTYGKLGVGR